MIPATGLDPFRVHGGRVEAARAMFGSDDWIDLSTGIAPWAYPVRPDPAPRLPDPAALADLEAAAGAAFGVAPGFSVVAVPGSDIALRLLAVVLGAARPAVVGRVMAATTPPGRPVLRSRSTNWRKRLGCTI